MILEIYIVEA